MFPAADFFDDGIGVGGPHEWFGTGIGLLQEAVDGGLEIDDAFEDAAFEPPSRRLGEEAFDCVEPGGGGWGEMGMKALVPFEPGANPRFREGRLLGCLWVA